MFAGYIFLYKGDSKDSMKRLSALISQFFKVAGYKINRARICTQYHGCGGTCKITTIHSLAKDVKDLHNENHKILKKVIEDVKIG